ncbi:hypothetical protein, partial [Escherichia coli]
ALLEIGRTTLWRKMKQHGIDAGQFKRRVWKTETSSDTSE